MSVPPCEKEFMSGTVIFLIVINIVSVLCGVCYSFYRCFEEAIVKGNYRVTERPIIKSQTELEPINNIY